MVGRVLQAGVLAYCLEPNPDPLFLCWSGLFSRRRANLQGIRDPMSTKLQEKRKEMGTFFLGGSIILVFNTIALFGR